MKLENPIHTLRIHRAIRHMRNWGYDRHTLNWIAMRAHEYEGVRDLLYLWDAEGSTEELELIWQDLFDIVHDINMLDGLGDRDGMKHTDRDV